MKKHLIDYVEWEGLWCGKCRREVIQADGKVYGCGCVPDEEGQWMPARFWLAVVNPGAPGNTSSPWPDLTSYRG